MAIVINGTSYQGKNITISNNKVFIDGVETSQEDAKEINIVVHGDIEKLQADNCNTIKVSGDVSGVSTLSGDVEIGGDVNGSIQTMSGDVKCDGSVTGNVNTMSGDIKHVGKANFS